MMQNPASLDNMRDIVEPAPVSWWPRISLLDMAPNLETGVAQMVLIAAALLAALVINVGPRSAVR